MLYCCYIVGIRQQERLDILPSLTAVEKISSASMKYSLYSGLGIWEIIDWIYVQYMTLRLLVPVQQVITFTVAGLSSPVTRCFFFFFNSLSFKMNAWDMCDELCMCIYTSKFIKQFIQMCLVSFCQRLSPSLDR